MASKERYARIFVTACNMRALCACATLRQYGIADMRCEVHAS